MMPDYRTLQLLYEDRLREIDRGQRFTPRFFEPGSLGRLLKQVLRLQHRPGRMTRYQPVHQKG